MMTESLTHQPTLKELKKAILKKAQNGNLELKKEFYSIDAEAYEFVDVNVFDDHKLLLFRCPKSKSTVSLILFNRTNQFGGKNE